MKIDTDAWGYYRVGDLFYRPELRIKKPDFNKVFDVSLDQNDEFTLPLVNAKHGNNGIMFYGREQDFESDEMCLDIVQNGASATGDVYAQIQKTGILWDAYLIKPFDVVDKYVLLFLSCVVERMIKQRFSYDDKAIWEKVQNETILLPRSSNGNPDWTFMSDYMKKIEPTAIKNISSLCVDYSPVLTKTGEWEIFEVGSLFKLYKPSVYHARQVTESENGINYVVRSKFNNGVKCKVEKPDSDINPKGVISFGSENASFFYQEEEWISGRDIYYVDTRGIDKYACLFLATCLADVTYKYQYNYGLFPELLAKEHIKLPCTSDGLPDWNYMRDYMKNLKAIAESNVLLFSQIAVI